MPVYETVSGAVEGLKARGFDIDFNLEENCLVCKTGRYEAGDFEITEVHRFEGESDPGDEAVVYGVKASAGDVQGVLVTGYGISAEGMSAEMAKKLNMHR